VPSKKKEKGAPKSKTIYIIHQTAIEEKKIKPYLTACFS
jgi:hypothetical protein